MKLLSVDNAAQRRLRAFALSLLTTPLALAAQATVAAELQTTPRQPVVAPSAFDAALQGEIRTVAHQPAPGTEAPLLPDTVVEADATPAPTEPPPGPPPQGPVGDPLEGSIYQSPFQVGPTDGFAATSSSVGGVTNTPLVDTPASIQIVTKEVLQDLQVFSVADSFRFVSGVNLTDSFGLGINYNVRGFAASTRRWNGLNDRIFRIAGLDTGNVDRIEFLKGPASLIYGSSSPGGFMNIVTKKPLPDAYTRLSLSTGSWGLARTDIDFNRPVDQEGNVLVRINVALQSADSFRDFLSDDRVLGAGVVSWNIDTDTVLTVEGEVLNISSLSDTGLLPVAGNLNALPINRSLNDPSNQFQSPSVRVAAYLDRQINDEWAFRLSAFGFRNNLDFNSNYPSAASIPASGNFTQSHFRGTESFWGPGGQFYLAGTSPVLGRENEFVFGAEIDYLDNQVTRAFNAIPLFPINAFNPVYQGYVDPGAINSMTSSRNTATGVFVQDAMWLTEEIRVLGGVRYDNNDNVLNNYIGGAYTRRRNDTAWTPRAGIVWEPIRDQLSGWYSYSESFAVGAVESGGRRFSGNPLAPDGGPLEPERGHQHELGWKWAAEDGSFILTSSLFQIYRENITTSSGIIGFSNQTGLGRSQGIEFDFYGQVTDNFSLIANYAYIDTRTISDANVAEIGQPLRQVPYNRLNLWGRYNLFDNGEEVLGVGLGMQWVDEARTGAGASLPYNPGYVKWDTGVFYNYGGFFANVFLENIFDRRYYTVGTSTGWDVGAPIGVRATAGLTF